MKIALVTDQHFGARGDSLIFDRFFERFYTKVFFPVIDQLGIKHVVDLGDTFDRRKFINYQTLGNCKRYWFDPLLSRGIHLDLIVGNHCTYFKNTNRLNSPQLLLGEYVHTDTPNIKLHIEPTDICYFDDLQVAIVPWICEDNRDRTYQMLRETKAEIVMGHLDISGFEMYRGHVNDGGEDPNVYNKFDQVFSGHFHHRSTKGNITYLGNPYEITWADYDDPRGFHIYETDTRELTFVENPFRMFHKLFYDDTQDVDYLTLDVKQYADKFVKVVVVNKSNYLHFDKFIDRLYNVNPAELKIIENISEDEGSGSTDTTDIEDTSTMLEHYVDAVDTDLDKVKLKTLMKSLYVEAKALEEAA